MAFSQYMHVNLSRYFLPRYSVLTTGSISPQHFLGNPPPVSPGIPTAASPGAVS